MDFSLLPVFIINLVFAVAAVFAAVAFSAWLDKRAGITSFKNQMGLITREKNIAVAVYLGARWVGIAIIIAATLG